MRSVRLRERTGPLLIPLSTSTRVVKSLVCIDGECSLAVALMPVATVVKNGEAKSWVFWLEHDVEVSALPVPNKETNFLPREEEKWAAPLLAA